MAVRLEVVVGDVSGGLVNATSAVDEIDWRMWVMLGDANCVRLRAGILVLREVLDAMKS